MKQELGRRVNGHMLVAVVFIVSLTTFPAPGHPAFTPWCIVCGDTFVVDTILNVILFTPLGFTLQRRGSRWWVATSIGLALSSTIEFAQNWIPGRDPSVRDVLCNTVGTAVGWWFAYHAHDLISPIPRRARRLALTAGLAWLALHALGDWLGLPAFPSEPYRIGYVDSTREFRPFDGKVLGVAINGAEVTDDSASQLERNLREGWYERGAINVTSRVIPSAEETGSLAPIVGVSDSSSRNIVVVGQLGSTLVLKLRSNAARARLRDYLFELDRAFPGRPGAIGVAGDSLVVVTERRRGEVRLIARAGDREHVSVRRLGPALVWTHFLFFSLPIGPATDAGSVVWLFLTLVPIGYWSAAAAADREAGDTRRVAIIVALLALLPALALVAFAAAFSLAWGPASQWAACAVGAAAGWWFWSRLHGHADPESVPDPSPAYEIEPANSLLRVPRSGDNTLLSRRQRG